MGNAPQPARSGLAPARATSPLVTVNLEVCRSLAEWLRSRAIPLERAESSLREFTTEQIGNFYLSLVAICHQTSPQGKLPLEGSAGGRHLRGWDYLFAKFEEAARRNSVILSPDFWSCITSDDLENVFRDERFGNRLSDPAGRASLLNDLGRIMLERSWKSASQIYDAAGGRIATGSQNLVGLLSQFRAYRDPVRKKLYLFLALMQNTGAWVYEDPEQLGAPVDYHEVRGQLRIGTVEIRDPDLHTRLLQGCDVTAEEDVSIRQAVQEALTMISEWSGVRNPSRLHYVFWNVFRSCCTRESPHCRSCPSTCSLPARYFPLASFPDGSRHCPFSETCRSAAQESKLLEPKTATDFY